MEGSLFWDMPKSYFKNISLSRQGVLLSSGYVPYENNIVRGHDFHNSAKVPMLQESDDALAKMKRNIVVDQIPT